MLIYTSARLWHAQSWQGDCTQVDEAVYLQADVGHEQGWHGATGDQNEQVGFVGKAAERGD